MTLLDLRGARARPKLPVPSHGFPPQVRRQTLDPVWDEDCMRETNVPTGWLRFNQVVDLIIGGIRPKMVEIASGNGSLDQ